MTTTPAVITLIRMDHTLTTDDRRFCAPPDRPGSGTWWGDAGWEGGGFDERLRQWTESLESLADRAYAQGDRWRAVLDAAVLHGADYGAAAKAADIVAPLFGRWCRGQGSLHKGYAIQLYAGEKGLTPCRGDLIPWDQAHAALLG